MATLLVIGGTGFFGKSILDCFQRGMLKPWSIDHIIVMARNAERLKEEAPLLLNQQVELLSADITKTDYLPQADFVIHAAASSDARDYLKSSLKERQNILSGILNYCKLTKIFHQKSKLLYVSSGAVYGKQPPELEKISEDYQFLDAEDIFEGKRDYACAKRDAELAVIKLGADGFHVSIARCFAFVGRWLPRDQHFAIGNFIDDILNRRPITVKARHKVYRSYMYADDLVEWLMTIVDHASPECPVYNVGSDQAILVGELASELSKKYSVKVDVPITTDAKVDRYIPSIAKAKSKLGLHLKYDLMTSVRETMRQIELQH